jgi:hypothetical protein
MGMAHSGLYELAKKKLKIDIDTLKYGEFVLFINKPFNACKLMTSNNVIVYYRHPQNHRLDAKALKLIPDFFDGKSLNYPKALKRILKAEYPHIKEFRAE